MLIHFALRQSTFAPIVGFNRHDPRICPVAGEAILVFLEKREWRARMKVLVIGATGNVGSAVVAELLKRGAEVRALVRKQPEAGKLPAGVEVAIADLLDPVSV